MQKYTLGILAGGQGRRAGGVDKGWLPWRGQPLIQYPLDRFAASASDIIISANREQERYQQLPAKIVADAQSGFLGPLAGLEMLLTHCTLWPLLVITCDAPNLPNDLPERMLEQLSAATPLCVAHDGERQQHLCLAFLDAAPLPSLKTSLHSDQRSVYGWLQGQPVTRVSFPNAAEQFRSINQPEQDN
ncbi:MAG: molybdenum cofactor guanylyltransferase [Alcanivoracaceae bacterium]|nr:molybdenum cofactor guanylyltransferase [Alcanivoracaceae bacterium]